MMAPRMVVFDYRHNMLDITTGMVVVFAFAVAAVLTFWSE
jgi:hypothetical protein